MNRVLIIDDDRRLTALLAEYLLKFQISALTSDNPLEGLRIFKTALPELIILDVMLPGMDGFEVLREIRKTSSVPVIMLTARGEIADKVIGLESGADDYLAKPFEPRELAARVQAILRRRSKDLTPEILRFRNGEIDIRRRSLKIGGIEVALTTAEFEMLRLLIENSGAVLSRDQIAEKMQSFDHDPSDRSIDVILSRLRQKLSDDPKNPSYIRTVRGSGYLFIGNENEST